MRLVFSGDKRFSACHCEEHGNEAIQLELQMDCRGRLRLPRNDKTVGSSAVRRTIQPRERVRTTYWILPFVQNDSGV